MRFCGGLIATADNKGMWIISSMHSREYHPASRILPTQDIQRLDLRVLQMSQTLHRCVFPLITVDRSEGLDLAIHRCGVVSSEDRDRGICLYSLMIAG